MEKKFWIKFSIALYVCTTLTSSAEIGHHKMRHHRKHHKRTNTAQSRDSVNNDDDQKRTIPPNIWALLASNSLMNRNQPNDLNDGPKYSNSDDETNRNEIDIDDLDFGPPKDDDDESIKKVSANCPKCKENSVKMSEDELASLRTEYVKNQILHKLGMNERPPPKSIEELPEPIQEGYATENEDDIDYLNRHLDDYFAKTTQKIIFLTQEFEQCKQQQSTAYPSSCFSFQISPDIDVSTVASAQLWIYKEQNNLDHEMNHTFMLSEIGFWGDNKKFVKSNPIASAEVNVNEGGWEKIDIAWPVKNWVEYHDYQHTIQVSCQSCAPNTMPISLNHDNKPFIVIDTYPQRTLNRKRKSVTCSPGSTECCRDSLYIDFTTIGWNDWIVHPKGYNAQFCRGSCNRVASITQTGSHHYTAVNKFMHHAAKNNKKKLELVPCCTATRYSSLEILYYDSNNTVTKATLPNMIVESCGCS